MNTGISIQHARLSGREDRDVRTDHAGFVAVVPEARWPRGARLGAVLPLEVPSRDALHRHRALPLVDPVTRAAVEAFFDNGGDRCTVLCVCVHDAGDLADPRRVDRALAPLIEHLRDDEQIALLAAPPLAWLPPVGETFRSLPAVAVLLRHCREVGNRFLLLDAPIGADERDTARLVRQLRQLRGVDPSYGALYFPWLQHGDTASPPSGAVAGLHARVALANAPFGVRVAPANQALNGVTHPQLDISWQQGAALLDQGINAIVVQPGRGVVVAGARTLSDDPRWRQIVARRIVSLATERIRRDAEWVVFEHLRPQLWESVERMVRARLDDFWSAGLLTGRAAGEEYRVQCDAELNPLSVRDAGQVHFKVLLRPISATEFVEIELQVGR